MAIFNLGEELRVTVSTYPFSCGTSILRGPSRISHPKRDGQGSCRGSFRSILISIMVNYVIMNAVLIKVCCTCKNINLDWPVPIKFVLFYSYGFISITVNKEDIQVFLSINCGVVVGVLSLQPRGLQLTSSVRQIL